jgi:hypothetical protein
VFTPSEKSPTGIDAPPETPSENGLVALVTPCAPTTAALETAIAATATNLESPDMQTPF